MVCQTKIDQGGTEDYFLNVCFCPSYQYRSILQESQTFAQPNSILDDVLTSQNEVLDV